MQIVHLIPTLAPSWHATQLRLLAEGLGVQGFGSQIMAWAGTPQRGWPAATQVASQGGSTPAACRWLVRRLAAVQPDVVHLWGFRPTWALHAAALLARAPRIVVSLGNEAAPDRAVARWGLAWRAGRIDRLTVACEPLRQRWVLAGCPAAKLASIPAGVAPPPACSREELMGELGLTGGAVLIGAAGQLEPARRIKDLIWAADLLKVARDDVHLLVFGDGPQRRRLELFRRQVQIEDKVHLLGRRDDWRRWLPHLSAFWSARATEGQPLAVLEAMAANVPVIVAQGAGLCQIVVPGKTGFCFELGDRAAIARHTQRLLEDRALAQRTGQAGGDLVRQQYPPEAMLARYAALYRSLS